MPKVTPDDVGRYVKFSTKQSNQNRGIIGHVEDGVVRVWDSERLPHTLPVFSVLLEKAPIYVCSDCEQFSTYYMGDGKKLIRCFLQPENLFLKNTIPKLNKKCPLVKLWEMDNEDRKEMVLQWESQR